MEGMFDEHGSFLEERMDPDCGLLDKLLANQTLSKIEYDDIKDQRPFYRRNARLLDYMRRKRKYDDRLICALKDTRQTHLVNYLIGNGERKSDYGGDWPLTESEISILDVNQECLVDLLDCTDLLGRLFSTQVINGRQRETISSEATNHRRNEVLLDVIRRRSVDDYRQLIVCLHQSNQSHVAKILDTGGVVVRVHADLGTSKAADHTEDDIITRFTDILSGKSLDEASRILKEIKLSVLAAKKGHSVVLYIYCRTDAELLDLYERSSSGKLRSSVKQLFSELLLFSSSASAESAEVTADNLKDVIECALTQQIYRSQIDRLTVTLPPAEYKKCRSYFSDEFIVIRAVCDLDQSNIGRREYDELKNTLRMRVMVERENHPHSMVLSFKRGDYMMTTAPTKIGNKDGWWKVEHLGSGRIGYIPRNCVVIDYSHEIRATSNNACLLKRPTSTLRTTTASSHTMIHFLPFELLDLILQKSYLHYALNRDRHHRRRRHHVYNLAESSDDDDESVIIQSLASVDRCWFERLVRKRRFKWIIWRRLSLALNKIHQSIIILRSNQSFLEEKIRLRRSDQDDLINQLRLSDCLSDIQSRLLSRQICGKVKLVSRRNNTSDLLSIVRSSFDDTRRSDCIRHLLHRLSNRKFITKVLDNGGVAVKMNLFGKDAGKLQQLSERLNDLHDKTKLRSEKMERVISQLRKNDIEIFSSQLDVRQIGLCIWCKSKAGLENLHKFYESNLIIDVIIGGLTMTTTTMTTTTTSSASQLIIGRRMIDVDIDQFKKTTVVCPTVVRFSARLRVDDDEEVKGVTTLRQEIALLCRTDSSSPHTIRVFQNRNPFRLNAKIAISEVEDPEDIGSSEKDNCFYVVDSKEKCVWKIPRQTGDHHKFIHLQSTHLHWPSTLSMSRDGQQLLMLTSHSICIYGVGGSCGHASAGRGEGTGPHPLQEVSCTFVRLPSDIDDPRHVVETSSGHFIVLHSLVKDVAEVKTTSAAESKKEEEKQEKQEEEEEEEEEKQEKEEEGEEEEKTMRRMFVVSKLTRDGQLVVCRFFPENKTQHQQQHHHHHQQQQQHHHHQQQHQHQQHDLNHPFYLAIDCDDRVFVADEGSDRVVLFDSDLSCMIRSLCPTEDEGGRGIRMPKRLCYDEGHRQLVVAGFFRKEGANVYSIERR